MLICYDLFVFSDNSARLSLAFLAKLHATTTMKAPFAKLFSDLRGSKALRLHRECDWHRLTSGLRCRHYVSRWSRWRSTKFCCATREPPSGWLQLTQRGLHTSLWQLGHLVMKKTNISVLKSTSRAFELVSKLAGTIQRPISHEFSLQLYPDALQSGSLFNFLSPPSCTLSTSCACKNCKSAFGVHSIQQEQTAC